MLNDAIRVMVDAPNESIITYETLRASQRLLLYNDSFLPRIQSTQLLPNKVETHVTMLMLS